MGVDWNINPLKDINWSLTPKQHRPPSHLVALIEEPSDHHYKEIARVERIALGTRTHKTKLLTEPCLLFYLIVSSGDHGWWQAPAHSVFYVAGFHPPPLLFYRFPVTDALSDMITREGWGVKSFFERAVTLRMNGTTTAAAREAVAQGVRADYRALFGDELVLKAPPELFY